ALIRREMRYLFWGITGVVVEDARGGTQAALDRFREMARRSTFGLCPRGYGKTSFRLYEMFYLDAVPVYIYDELWLPYMDVLDWTEFAVLCHKRELLGLREQLVRLEEDGAAEKMRGRRLALREDYFSHDGMCRQIVRYLESY
ncbi:MAG: exostosin family protein, partial [Phycisphaerae bacterium]